MKHPIRQYIFSGCAIQLRDVQRDRNWHGGNKIHWQVWHGNPLEGRMLDQGMAENEQMAHLYAQEAVKRHQKRMTQQTQVIPPNALQVTEKQWTLQELLKAAGFQDDSAAS